VDEHQTRRNELQQQLRTHACKWFSGRTCYPEPQAIEAFVPLWQNILLPNYYPHAADVDVMDKLYQLLVSQIHRALFQLCMQSAGTEESIAVAQLRANEFLEHLPHLQESLHEDVLTTFNGDPAASGFDEIILTYPGLLALQLYRAAHVLQRMGIPLLPRMMTEYAHRITGIDIHPGAVLGRGIMIDHGTGIVIGETAVIGNRVKLYQGVTIGALYFPRDEAGSLVRQTKRHPTIEDDVVLYAHATVLGGDTVIGHGSVIGSQAWITESVPPYAKVLYQSEHRMVLHQQ